MEEILALLKSAPEEAIKKLTVSAVDAKTLEDINKEFELLDRTLRDTQVGVIQKDKTVGTGEKTRLVTAIKIPIPFQNKIVNTATAFEVGESVDIMPNEQNELSEEIKRIWRNNRLDNKIQTLKRKQKSELQSALLFYIDELKPDNVFNRLIGVGVKREIKCRVLTNDKGIMAPYFDAMDDMQAFTWQFTTIVGSKSIKNVWVYTATDVIKLDNTSGTIQQVSTDKHGFTKIPVVYTSQKTVEWEIAKPMIDRLEVAMSKLAGANDYFAHPMLKITGKVEGAPDRNDDGKVFIVPMEKDNEGNIHKGDVDFIKNSSAPESAKLEIAQLEKYIYSLTSTPDISFDNLKGLGSISGIAIKLMFLDAIMKAKMNEGENRTIVERALSIIISGTVKTVNTKLNSLAPLTYFDVSFNSILPDDIKEAIEMYGLAVEKKIMSRQTAVKNLNLTNDEDQELLDIQGTTGDPVE